MKGMILRDFFYGLGLAVLMYVAGASVLEILSNLGAVLLVVVLVTVWLYRKTYSQAVRNLIGVARILQVPVIFSLVGLGVSFYMNRYNTGPLIFVMILASLGSVGVSYKLLLDWTVELEEKKRIKIEKYKKTVLIIVILWLIAEGTLLFVSM